MLLDAGPCACQTKDVTVVQIKSETCVREHNPFLTADGNTRELFRDALAVQNTVPAARYCFPDREALVVKDSYRKTVSVCGAILFL